ncbi:hypothetical protein JXJ21_08625 [candidate division KSB1 bacterium]|nr:hypothetical protein [candidate division KSB1 bacterium]
MIIEIAGIVFSISSDQPMQLIRLEESYRDFLCNKEPEVAIHARFNGLPQISLQNEDKVFDSESLWSLFQINGQNVFVLRRPATGIYRIAVFDTDFKRGEVYSRVLGPEEMSDSLLSNPLAYPLSEVLMMCLLARGRGLLVHSCGIDDGGRGYLFAGNSTNGKSTMAGLWRDKATILNDDRIVLRQREGRFWMYGTPWHGDYTGVSPRGVPLEKVFFLRHAKANIASRKEASSASSMLLTRCFPTLWEKEGMSFTLDFCAQLLADVPCYELGFVPDRKVVDFVRCVE